MIIIPLVNDVHMYVLQKRKSRGAGRATAPSHNVNYILYFYLIHFIILNNVLI